MYFRYQYIHWYIKFENDEVERILSCSCTVLYYILEYIYIGQIAKRSTSPMFAFNMQNPTKHSRSFERKLAAKVYSTRQFKSMRTSFKPGCAALGTGCDCAKDQLALNVFIGHGLQKQTCPRSTWPAKTENLAIKKIGSHMRLQVPERSQADDRKTPTPNTSNQSQWGHTIHSLYFGELRTTVRSVADDRAIASIWSQRIVWRTLRSSGSANSVVCDHFIWSNVFDNLRPFYRFYGNHGQRKLLAKPVWLALCRNKL